MGKGLHLYLVATFHTQVDEKNGNKVVDVINQPEWVVASSEDRAKAKKLSEYLDDENWDVKVIQTVNF